MLPLLEFPVLPALPDEPEPCELEPDAPLWSELLPELEPPSEPELLPEVPELEPVCEEPDEPVVAPFDITSILVRSLPEKLART